MATGTIPSQKAFIKKINGVQQTGTINANAGAWIDVPFDLPVGYSPISISRVYVTGVGLVIYHFGLSTTSNAVTIAMRNIGSSAVAYTVDASVGCIKVN